MVLKFQTGIDLLTVFNYMYTVVVFVVFVCDKRDNIYPILTYMQSPVHYAYYSLQYTPHMQFYIHSVQETLSTHTISTSIIPISTQVHTLYLLVLYIYQHKYTHYTY